MRSKKNPKPKNPPADVASGTKPRVPLKHISFARPQGGDNLPPPLSRQIRTILNDARFVLRRRTQEETEERAAVILGKLQEFRLNMTGVAIMYGTKTNVHDDDADLLDFLILPDRQYPFRRTQGEGIRGAQWAAEKGWIKAEDLGVLAMTKIDAAVGIILAKKHSNPSGATCLLLDASNCVLVAERFGGRHVQTEDEFDETMESLSAAARDYDSWQKQEAGKSRIVPTRSLMEIVLGMHKKIKEEHPGMSDRAIAIMITKKYGVDDPVFSGTDDVLNGEIIDGRDFQPAWMRTIYGWILKRPKPEPDMEHILLGRSVRKKHTF